MADNLRFGNVPITVAVPSGVTSGDPVCIGRMPGVAVIDRNSAGNASVDFRNRVWDLSVNAVDDAGNVAVAVGDDLYYTAADTIKISKKASGIYYGTALETITSGSSDTIMVRIGGTGERSTVQHAKAFSKLDLSGSAQADVVVVHSSQALTVVKAILLYTEASSTHAGVDVTIGNETDADHYYIGSSATGQSQWAESSVTLLKSTVAAGDTVLCGHAGSKTGAGEILVCLEYVVA
jgi:predicted RecA/RadA family phage recombinase